MNGTTRTRISVIRKLTDHGLAGPIPAPVREGLSYLTNPRLHGVRDVGAWLSALHRSDIAFEMGVSFEDVALQWTTGECRTADESMARALAVVEAAGVEAATLMDQARRGVLWHGSPHGCPQCLAAG